MVKEQSLRMTMRQSAFYATKLLAFKIEFFRLRVDGKVCRVSLTNTLSFDNLKSKTKPIYCPKSSIRNGRHDLSKIARFCFRKNWLMRTVKSD